MSIRRYQMMALNWLRKLVRPGDVIEVFIKDSKNPPLQFGINWTGYYDRHHLHNLIDDTLAHSGRALGVYFRINPVNPDAIARSSNRLQPSKNAVPSKAEDIVRRRLLFIDIDPKRPRGVSATDAELKRARDKAETIRQYLLEREWPDPVKVESGNGYFLWYGVDLPTNDDGLIRSVLDAIAERFDDDHVKIDTSVSDAVRLARLPGTLNCKGDDLPERPHRYCRIVGQPKGALRAVPTKLLQQLALKPPVAVESGRKNAELLKVIEDARQYLSKMQPAIEGQGGHKQTFKVACRLIIDFDLSPDQAWPIALEYNARCKPPWSDADLRRKLEEADTSGRSSDSQRGRLKRRLEAARSEYAFWEPLEGKEFVGWVPDFGDCAARDALMPLEHFELINSSKWADFFVAWRLTVSHPMVPDIYLRQLYWGAVAPRNWRRQLRRWRDQELLESTGHRMQCSREQCVYRGLGIRHKHFPTIISNWGFLENTTRWVEPVKGKDMEEVEQDYGYTDETYDRDYEADNWAEQEDSNFNELESDDLEPGHAEEVGHTNFDRNEDEKPQYPPTECRFFPLYEKRCSEKLKAARKLGFVIPLYWPALLFGASPRIGWRPSAQRLLVGLVRELTRSETTSKLPEIVSNALVITAGRGTDMLPCPLLDSAKDYVVFGGNGSRPGRGYQIFGRTFRGWLSRAGYWQPDKVDSTSDEIMLRRFLADLARLAEDLAIEPVAYYPSHPIHKWRSMAELKHCLGSSAGREWLTECSLRIFAPADYLVRWRYFFAKKLRFRWIPRSVDDAGPMRDLPELDDDQALHTGDQVRRWLGRLGFTQELLAAMLTECMNESVSRQRISRLINGRYQSEELFYWINELRRAGAVSIE
jgi:hypothetical protein